MWFDKSMVRLAWTLPPGNSENNTTRAQDIDNLKVSGVKGVQMPIGIIDNGVLSLLDELDVSDNMIRIPASMYDSPAAVDKSTPRIKSLAQTGLFKWLGFGIEPDEGKSALFGSPDWGEKVAEKIRDGIYNGLASWQHLGLKILSPALTYRGHYRDWNSTAEPGGGLAPGWFRWHEILRDAANACWANQHHIYSADGSMYDVDERLRTSLWLAQSVSNQPIYIAEINADRGTDVEQMAFIIRFMNYLLPANSDPRRPFGRAGERVVGVTPFCANGNAVGWPEIHRITDIRAYEQLGAWMRS